MDRRSPAYLPSLPLKERDGLTVRGEVGLDRDLLEGDVERRTESRDRIKELALHAFQEFAKGNYEPLRPLLHEDFVEHSPGNPSGRDAFIDFIAQAPVAGSQFDLRRVIADDTYVVMHYRMTTPGNPPGEAVVTIWRFENDQIVEHWDVVQPIPSDSQVPHGML